jgi:hypothetical protein
MDVAKKAKQPRGGYVPIRLFDEYLICEEEFLNDEENLDPGLVGTAVSLMARKLLVPKARQSESLQDLMESQITRAAILGARHMEQLGCGSEAEARELAKAVRDLSDESIVAACQLSRFESCYRAGKGAYVDAEKATPDAATIENIRVMVKRAIDALRGHGGVTGLGVSFRGAYTKKVDSGDADLTTAGTVWEIDASEDDPTSAHTLQILMYYLMGRRSRREFLTIENIAILNPRQNTVWQLKVADLPPETIRAVERDVIGYAEDSEQ